MIDIPASYLDKAKVLDSFVAGVNQGLYHTKLFSGDGMLVRLLLLKLQTKLYMVRQRNS